MRRSGTKLILTTAFHPQGDGQTKKINVILNIYLRNCIIANYSDWVNMLSQAEFCYNTTYATSIGMTPFKVAYGFSALKPTDLVLEKKDENSPSTYFSEEGATWVFKKEHIQKMTRHFLT